MTTCLHNKLSPLAVPQTILEEQLTLLVVEFRKSKRKLVIGLDNIFQYYEFPLVKCHAGKKATEIIIKLDIAVAPDVSEFEVVEVFTLPF